MRHLAIVAALLLTGMPGFGRLKAAPEPTVPETAPAPPRLDPPAASKWAQRRHRMVQSQIQDPDDTRIPVKDEPVLAAIRACPRHAFVPESLQERAYDDTPLPIGEGQTISQPYIVALMTQLLELQPEDRVLEIGTGSGYQAAVLGHLSHHVWSVEIVEALATRARVALDAQGYDHVATRAADGYFGWKEHGPFDAIIVTCAAGHLPPPLWEQLKPGGRIVIPIGGPYDVQRLIVVEKTADGQRRSRSVIAVQFVPMTGQVAQGQSD